MKTLLFILLVTFGFSANAITYIYNGSPSCKALNISATGVITCGTTGTNPVPFNFNYPLICTAGIVISGSSGLVTCLDFTDMWWDPAESGWGMSVVQHNNMIFAAIYSYDANGQPFWYVMSNCPLNGMICNGAIYKVTGGVALAQPWNGNNKVVTQVGNGTLNFAEGTFTFTIDGYWSSKFIERQGF